MEIKNNGIELAVRATPGQGAEQLGDLVITKTRLIWCPGQTTRQNGREISWQEFIAFMEGRRLCSPAIGATSSCHMAWWGGPGAES